MSVKVDVTVRWVRDAVTTPVNANIDPAGAGASAGASEPQTNATSVISGAFSTLSGQRPIMCGSIIDWRSSFGEDPGRQYVGMADFMLHQGIGWGSTSYRTTWRPLLEWLNQNNPEGMFIFHENFKVFAVDSLRTGAVSSDYRPMLELQNDNFDWLLRDGPSQQIKYGGWINAGSVASNYYVDNCANGLADLWFYWINGEGNPDTGWLNLNRFSFMHDGMPEVSRDKFDAVWLDSSIYAVPTQTEIEADDFAADIVGDPDGDGYYSTATLYKVYVVREATTQIDCRRLTGYKPVGGGRCRIRVEAAYGFTLSTAFVVNVTTPSGGGYDADWNVDGDNEERTGDDGEFRRQGTYKLFGRVESNAVAAGYQKPLRVINGGTGTIGIKDNGLIPEPTSYHGYWDLILLEDFDSNCAQFDWYEGSTGTYENHSGNWTRAMDKVFRTIEYNKLLLQFLNNDRIEKPWLFMDIKVIESTDVYPNMYDTLGELDAAFVAFYLCLSMMWDHVFPNCYVNTGGQGPPWLTNEMFWEPGAPIDEAGRLGTYDLYANDGAGEFTRSATPDFGEFGWARRFERGYYLVNCSDPGAGAWTPHHLDPGYVEQEAHKFYLPTPPAGKAWYNLSPDYENPLNPKRTAKDPNPYKIGRRDSLNDGAKITAGYVICAPAEGRIVVLGDA